MLKAAPGELLPLNLWLNGALQEWNVLTWCLSWGCGKSTPFKTNRYLLNAQRASVCSPPCSARRWRRRLPFWRTRNWRRPRSAGSWTSALPPTAGAPLQINPSLQIHTHTHTNSESHTTIWRLPSFKRIHVAVIPNTVRWRSPLSLPMRYRFSGVVTGRLTTLQVSASASWSQQVDPFAQVLLLDEFTLFTCKHRAEEQLRLTEAARAQCSRQNDKRHCIRLIRASNATERFKNTALLKIMTIWIVQY